MCSIIKSLWHTALAAVVLPALLCACSDVAPDVPEDSGNRGSLLRFAVKQGSSSRMVNDGVSSTFEYGDRVGCVIAFRNAAGTFDYQATTSWRYANGMLVLDKIYTVNGSRCASHDAAPDRTDYLICRHPGFGDEEGYVQLNVPGKEYCFFFYYPFITNVEADAAFNELTGMPDADAYKLKVPFSGFALDLNPNWDNYWYNSNKKSLTVVGIPDAETAFFTDGTSLNGSQEQHPHFCWTAFPCFASIAQGSKEQLNNSNFMWVRYIMDQRDPSKPVTMEDATTHYTVDLQFRKKMAAIDLIIDDPDIETTDGTVYYRNTPEEANKFYNGNYNNFFYIGKRIDLSTGTFTEYPQIRQEWQAQSFCKEPEYAALYASCLCDSYEDNQKNAHYNRIRPGRLDNGAYRMILPPQNKFMCELHFRKNGVEHVIDLYSKLQQLKENTLYTIRLTDTGQWEVKIRDWDEGTDMLIEENE